MDAEFTNTLTELQMQGMNLNKIKGGRKEQQRIAKAVAMESTSRILTRRALETLKSIATGEYKAPESGEPAAEAHIAPAEELADGEESGQKSETESE
jgi:hypothetical protein